MRQPPTIVRRALGRLVRWKGLFVLNYHRIGDGRRSIFDRGLWSATASGLDEQARYLKKNFDVISPDDIPHVISKKRGRHVLITFDDGYADNYTDGFPVLRSHNLPAAFYIATGFIDEPHFPWWDQIAWMVRSSKLTSMSLPEYLDAPVPFVEPDREMAIRTIIRGYKLLPTAKTPAYLDAVGKALGTGRPGPDALDVKKLWMTWDMLREMHKGGMTIGGHTVRHPVLSRLSRDEQSAEIKECQKRIEDEVGVKFRTFAYPVGEKISFNEDTRSVLREVGVHSAFTYYGGIGNLRRWDDLDIPRVAIEQHMTIEEFKAIVMFPWTTRV